MGWMLSFLSRSILFGCSAVTSWCSTFLWVGMCSNTSWVWTKSNALVGSSLVVRSIWCSSSEGVLMLRSSVTLRSAVIMCLLGFICCASQRVTELWLVFAFR